MRAIIIQTGRHISPFGDRPRDVLFAAGTVGLAPFQCGVTALDLGVGVGDGGDGNDESACGECGDC